MTRAAVWQMLSKDPNCTLGIGMVGVKQDYDYVRYTQAASIMATVFTLLSLPKTSSAFTTLKPTILDSKDSSRPTGLITIQITGDQRKLRFLIIHIYYIHTDPVGKPSVDHASFPLIKRCLKVILTRDSDETCPCTNEVMYAACRSIVTVLNKGEGLYDTLKMELERSVARLATDLTASSETGINWIVEFVKVCKWFESRVVRFSQNVINRRN